MDLLSQLTGLWKKPELPVATPTVAQPPTALEQRQPVLAHHAQATTVTDSVVCRACAATGLPGSSSDLELTSNAQDTSNDVAPV